MNKFEDVDVIASLEAIMKQNTAFYQNDFDLDRNILQKALPCSNLSYTVSSLTL